MTAAVRAFAPGRVNLIGDHTDYTGGLACPMAVDLGTTVEVEPGGDVVRLTSDDEPDDVTVPLDVTEPQWVTPEWGRYVAGVVAELRPAEGGRGRVSTTLPVGAGLSSSAALEVATALTLGFDGNPLELALLCQRAEQRASGVPCGLLDQLTLTSARDGHAMIIDFTGVTVRHVPVPGDAEIVVLHSGEPRRLAGSAYADRRQQCELAAAAVGPLADAGTADLAAIPDPVLRRRARHVVTENERVREFAAALADGDLRAAGTAMTASHRSLAEDFEVSTPRLDRLAAELRALPGVYGARLTGAGFGGCVVALTDPGAVAAGRVVRASAAARVLR